MDAVQMEMHARIQGGSRSMKDPAGRDVRILRDQDGLQIAAELGHPLREIYMAALGLGICPYRYLRNREAISLTEQLELAKAQVGLVGAGGLGGHIILLLARVGIGRLVVVDHDVFDETNLNRQALSTRG
ncbi:MAG: ThiF family adenylyltransferase, partial [Proteobacteria bacterium]|nr:ThiF family adenylyltransferase [Pseudomonadota bacterium]